MKTLNFKMQTLIFLLLTSAFSAISEVKNGDETVKIFVINPSSLEKKSETIEIPWQNLAKIKGLNPKEIIVKNEDSGLEILSQVVYNGQKNPQSIIFQTDIAAKASQKFIITKGVPTNSQSKVYGRQVKERSDDFAWENDKVAFRMYGEALEGKAGMAKGIDFWAKRTTNLVVNEWYKSGNYHKDNGDGVDAYHVGMTLGCGDSEPIVDGNIIYPINYSDYQLLDNGPIRISFKLIYKPFKVNGKTVKETKNISLDAGSQLNKIVNHYETEGNLEIAAGVTKHKNDGQSKIDKAANYVAYWDQADGGMGNGFMGVGLIYPIQNPKEFKETDQHVMMIVNPDKNNNVIYYQGGGWSKSGNFSKQEVWFNYLEKFSGGLKNPLIIKSN